MVPFLGNDEHSRIEKYKRKKYNKQNKLENVAGQNRNNGSIHVSTLKISSKFFFGIKLEKIASKIHFC